MAGMRGRAAAPVPAVVLASVVRLEQLQDVILIVVTAATRANGKLARSTRANGKLARSTRCEWQARP
eukprot:361540-Prymnesium_polylepis.1